MSWKLAACALLCASTGENRAGAQQLFDSSVQRQVAPGVTHRRIVIKSGPWHVNVLEIDLRHPDVQVVAMRANNSFLGRETVSAMSSRYHGPGKVVAGINGDFFNIRTGENENNTVIDGVYWKGVKITDSPYDTFNTIHSQFGLDRGNRPLIERFRFEGFVRTGRGGSKALDALNFWPDSNALVLYTKEFGDSTPADSIGRNAFSLKLQQVGKRGDTLVLRTDGLVLKGGSVSLAGGAVIAAGVSRQGDLKAMARRGQMLKVFYRLSPAHAGVQTVIGGWPRLILHGRSTAEFADILEGTFPRFSRIRHPRTALGFSRDSATLFLVTVDGRSESDSGMSLSELAALMLQLGVYEGMNLDGGGSTSMLVGDRIVNSPSDKTGERSVGSGLFVVQRPGKH